MKGVAAQYNESLRSLYRHSFYEFMKRSFETVAPGKDFIDGWHMRFICKVLQEKGEALLRGESQKSLIINIPPRSLKSIMVTVSWPMWLWTIRPQTNIIGSSYSSDLSTDHNVMSRNIFDSQWFRDLYPHLKAADDQDEKRKFTNNHGGTRRCTSTMGTITGGGGDVVIADDATNPMQADSQKEREKAIIFWDRTLSTRLDDPKTGFFVVVMQRLHKKDLTGHILSEDTKNEWQQIVIPGEESSAIKPESLRKYYTDGLFFPERFDREWIERIKKRLGSYGYAGQIGQRPAPEGGGIWQKWLIPVPDNQMPAIFEDWGTDWDLAYTEKEMNDASAFVESGIYNGMMYINNLGYVRKEFPELVKFMKIMRPPHYIEAKASGKSAKQALTRQGIAAIEVEKVMDKVAQARKATPHAEAGLVFIRESLMDKLYNDVEQGILDFPNNEHDDLQDAFTQAILRHFALDEFWTV